MVFLPGDVDVVVCSIVAQYCGHMHATHTTSSVPLDLNTLVMTAQLCVHLCHPTGQAY